MIKLKISLFLTFALLGFFQSSYAQLQTTSASGITPLQLVQNILVGTGVTVSNVKFNGSLSAPTASNQLGSFTTGTNVTNLGFPNGIIMSTGGISSATNGQTSTAITGTELTTVAELLQYAGANPIYDAAVLEFDFIPLSDTIKFRYVFGSREYPVFVCTQFNDIFGFFISGMNPTGPNYANKNIALIPGTNNPVSINTINGGVSQGTVTPCILTNTQYYHTPIPNITYNGLTTALTAWALVIPCTPYHMKLTLADLGDRNYDSGVFLEANSFSSPQISINTAFSSPIVSTQNAIEGCNNIILTFKFPYNVPYPFQIPIVSIGGTATNGVDYPMLPNLLTIPTGSDSVRLVISPFYDHISEGMETIRLVFQTSVCGDLDTVVFNIQNYDSLSVEAYGDTILCNNQTPISVVAQNGITPYQYFWSNGAGNTAMVTPTLSATTMYYIMVRDACFNTSSDSVLVVIDCDFAKAGPDTSICLGGTAILHASIDTTKIQPIGIPSFYWTTGDTTAIISVSPVVTTTYIVTATDVFSDNDTVTVFVNPLPVVTATTSFSTICLGDSAILHASGAQTYFWTANISDVSLIGQQTLEDPIVSPAYTTLYTVKGTDTNTCSNTATVNITISPIPNPQIVAFPNPVSVFDPTVHIYDASGGNNTYIWNTGDGVNSTQSSFYHTYSDLDTGSYLIDVIVANPYGCLNTSSLWVVVRPDGTFYMPNSFTPNDDGLNDVFKAYGMGIQEFEMNIYDRWGKNVFTSKDINAGWDGKINNEAAPGGIYVYMIIYKDRIGIEHMKSGSTTILR